MLVDDMRKRMSHQEYLEWYVYFRRKAQRDELESKRRGGGE